MMVADGRSSVIAVLIAHYLLTYVLSRQLGTVTGADGGYQVGSQRYMPDVGFTRRSRATGERKSGFFTYAPDLAIEMLSPTDLPRHIRLKIANYLSAGTTVWLVDPQTHTVEVYKTGQDAQLFSEADTLTDDVLLPDFALPLAPVWEAM